MTEAWLVFLLGSSLSFAPLYLLLSWLASLRKTAPAVGPQRAPELDPKGLFLDCLRRESIARTEAALLEAWSLWCAPGKAGDPRREADRQRTANRLGEARKTIADLFSDEAAATFDKACLAIRSRWSATGGPSDVIGMVKATLLAHVDHAGGAPRQRMALAA